MDLKVEGPWNTEKYCWPPWLSDQCYIPFSEIYLSISSDNSNSVFNQKRIRQKLEILLIIVILSRSKHRRRSVKNAFLKILQNSQENACARDSFLIKFQGLGLQLY